VALGLSLTIPEFLPRFIYGTDENSEFRYYNVNLTHLALHIERAYTKKHEILSS